MLLRLGANFAVHLMAGAAVGALAAAYICARQRPPDHDAEGGENYQNEPPPPEPMPRPDADS